MIAQGQSDGEELWARVFSPARAEGSSAVSVHSGSTQRGASPCASQTRANSPLPWGEGSLFRWAGSVLTSYLLTTVVALW
jgi:hypothetical protein